MKKNFWFFCFSLANIIGFSQNNKLTVSGFIEDSITGERLLSATVFINNKATGQTNQFGFFSLTITAAEVPMHLKVLIRVIWKREKFCP